jgi:hypothetical protein
VVRIDGRLQDETLQTRADFVTPQGAHALKPARSPWIDPALGEFVDRYREALRTGKATLAGHGSVNGRSVTWLEFSLEHGATQRVAIDDETSLPVRVETDWGGGGPVSSYAVRKTSPFETRGSC